MIRIAARMSHARESGTARIARITAEREAAGQHVLRLNIGEPDFNTPEYITATAWQAIRDGKTRYTNVAGTPELRNAIVNKFKYENNLSCKLEQTVVGTGAKQLIFNALLVTVQAGDEVVIPTPSWVSYPDITAIADAQPVTVPCLQQHGFKLLPQELEKVLNKHTRWLILNSPCNPTGAVYTADELRQLAEVIRLFPQLAIMCDDIYEKIIFDGCKFYTMAEVAPDLSDRILTVNGVSKSHAMTGWRIGYATGPKELIAEMIKLQSQSTTNPSSISQAAALAALTETKQTKEFISQCVRIYQHRRDFVLEKIDSIPQLECLSPDGAFYAFIRCNKLLGRKTPSGRLLTSDTDFCEYLLQHAGVSTVPGVEFNGSGYFRISFATSEDVLEEALGKIQASVAAL